MLMRLLPLTMEQGRDEHPSGSHVLAANLAVRSKNVTLRPACQDEPFERKSCSGQRIAGAQVAEKRRNALIRQSAMVQRTLTRRVELFLDAECPAAS